MGRWDREALEDAEELLARASAQRRLGPYQLEAAIQSAHCQRRLGANVPGEALLALYDGLVALRPNAGALVSRACAVEAVLGAKAALTALAELPQEWIRNYQPYWAVRAHLLQSERRSEEASTAYDMAIALAQSPAIKKYLLEKRSRLSR